MIPPFIASEYDSHYGCEVDVPNRKDWVGKWVGVQYMNGGYYAGTVTELDMIACDRCGRLRMVIDNGEMLASVWVEDVPVLLVKKHETKDSWVGRG